jgi:hypothetical protein
MKKFYLSIIALAGLTVTAMAQADPDCPFANGQYYTTAASPTFCKLYVGFLPSGDVGTTGTLSIIGSNDQPIPDVNGNTSQAVPAGTTALSVEYACQGIKRVEYNFYSGGIVKECTFIPIGGATTPVKLTAFNGKLSTETEATLSWATSLEDNSFQYEVQRSADGKNYVTVGKVVAAGTSIETVKYNFNDVLPGAGAYFYRLKMVDLDGKTEMSKSVYVNSKKGTSVVTKIFPNPFTSEVQLIGATSADLNTPGNIKVFNMAGQRINFRIVGANAIAIDEKASKGMYFIQVGEVTHKLLKN